MSNDFRPSFPRNDGAERFLSAMLAAEESMDIAEKLRGACTGYTAAYGLPTHDDLLMEGAREIDQLRATLARKEAAMSALREWMRYTDWMRFAADHEEHAAQFPVWEKE
jgi:hypothetical protein